jgi:hypothetical protein
MLRQKNILIFFLIMLCHQSMCGSFFNNEKIIFKKLIAYCCGSILNVLKLFSPEQSTIRKTPEAVVFVTQESTEENVIETSKSEEESLCFIINKNGRKTYDDQDVDHAVEVMLCEERNMLDKEPEVVTIKKIAKHSNDNKNRIGEIIAVPRIKRSNKQVAPETNSFFHSRHIVESVELSHTFND